MESRILTINGRRVNMYLASELVPIWDSKDGKMRWLHPVLDAERIERMTKERTTDEA